MCSRHAMGVRDYVSVRQPPKPPRARDFILSSGQSKKRADDVRFTDISVVQKASSDIGLGDAVGDKHCKNKSNGRRSKKATVHRTQSETHLNSTELPENHELSVSLSKTKPQLLIREFGIRQEKAIRNAEIYLSQNARKCKEWLKTVEASEPLDGVEEVDLAQGSGVSLEIPDERWDDNSERNSRLDHTSLTRESVARYQGHNEQRVVVHHILVHEYTDALDNTRSTSATLGESEGSGHPT